MGNRWSQYWAFEAEAFVERYWNISRTVGEGEWAAMVDRSLDWVATTYERQLRHIAPLARQRLVDDRLRLERNARLALGGGDEPNGERAKRQLDGEDAAKTIIDYCAAECCRGHLADHDVVHDLTVDFPIDQYLIGDARRTAREAWDRLLHALGYDVAIGEPWWVCAAYPSDHYVGLTPHEDLVGLVDQLRETKVGELIVRLAEECGRGRESFKALLRFLEAAAERGDWVLSVESGN